MLSYTCELLDTLIRYIIQKEISLSLTIEKNNIGFFVSVFSRNNVISGSQSLLRNVPLIYDKRIITDVY